MNGNDDGARLEELYKQAESLESQLMESKARERKLRARYERVVETAERLESMVVDKGAAYRQASANGDDIYVAAEKLETQLMEKEAELRRMRSLVDTLHNDDPEGSHAAAGNGLPVSSPLTSLLHLFSYLCKTGIITKVQQSSLKEKLLDICISPHSRPEPVPANSVGSDMDSLISSVVHIDPNEGESYFDSATPPFAESAVRREARRSLLPPRPTGSSRIQRRRHYQEN